MGCTQETLKVKQGDLQLPVPLTLTDTAGAPINLSGLPAGAVTINIRPIDSETPLFTGRVCTVDAPTAGEISFSWETGDTATPGLYIAEVQVAWLTGEPQTFPGDGFIELFIEADLAETAARSMARTRLELAAATRQDPALDAAAVSSILDRARRADTTGRAPSDTGWVETYDVLAAAIEAWETKAGLAACRTDVEAAGVKSARSQIQQNCLQMAAMLRRRRTSSTAMVGPNGDATQASLPVGNSDWEPTDTAGRGAAGSRQVVPW